jgi:hypothetical protein
MKLTACFVPPLVVLSATLACSSSSSSGETTPTPDGSTPDSHTQQPDTSTPTPDSSTTPDTSPPPSTDAGTDSSTLSFATDIYTPIIEAHCIFCHGPTADGGEGSGESFGKLDMSSVDAGYAHLVNIVAQGGDCALIDGSAGPIRVVPGNAADSLLYLKVNGFTVPPPCGSAMPKNGEIPDGGQAIVAEQIQTWINQGAKP